jgi:uncharacterized protein YjeT (DUF2065 family)
MAEEGVSQSRDGAAAHGIERAGAIVAELAEAFGAALIALAEEQEALAAERISAAAEATRCAARSFGQSATPEIAHGVEAAAERIDGIARIVRQRNWREVVTETTDFARRQPGLFGVAAMAVGFLVGRLLTLPAARSAEPAAMGGGHKTADSTGGAEH